jgi:hypothetical protein
MISILQIFKENTSKLMPKMDQCIVWIKQKFIFKAQEKVLFCHKTMRGSEF